MAANAFGGVCLSYPVSDVWKRWPKNVILVHMYIIKYLVKFVSQGYPVKVKVTETKRYVIVFDSGSSFLMP